MSQFFNLAAFENPIHNDGRLRDRFVGYSDPCSPAVILQLSADGKREKRAGERNKILIITLDK